MMTTIMNGLDELDNEQTGQLACSAPGAMEVHSWKINLISPSKMKTKFRSSGGRSSRKYVLSKLGSSPRIE